MTVEGTLLSKTYTQRINAYILRQDTYWCSIARDIVHTINS